jgi:plastocyanin
MLLRPTALALALLLAGRPLGAQSLLDRPPNLSGGWVGASGTMYFHFLHRFTASKAPERKVTNVPTFLVALALPARVLVGANYATNSQLAPAYPNEWELFARHMVFAQADGSPVDVGAQVAYNLASEGVDGELSLARRQGRLRALAAARVLADPFQAGRTRFAAGGGATFRLTRSLALAGDVATLLNPEPGERTAWSAGLHLAIPYTPHSLSIQASNTNAATLQGASRGEDVVRYGFEFTVPLTLRRWFGGRGGGTTPAPSPSPAAPGAARPTPSPSAPTATAPTAVVAAGMRNFAFTPARIEVAAGGTVEWKNEDQMAHTVTAAGGAFDSGPIEPGASWRRTFDAPGEYPFFCTPHPFMKGVVVVR